MKFICHHLCRLLVALFLSLARLSLHTIGCIPIMLLVCVCSMRSHCCLPCLCPPSALALFPIAALPLPASLAALPSSPAPQPGFALWPPPSLPALCFCPPSHCCLQLQRWIRRRTRRADRGWTANPGWGAGEEGRAAREAGRGSNLSSAIQYTFNEIMPAKANLWKSRRCSTQLCGQIAKLLYTALLLIKVVYSVDLFPTERGNCNLCPHHVEPWNRTLLGNPPSPSLDVLLGKETARLLLAAYRGWGDGGLLLVVGMVEIILERQFPSFVSPP